MSRIVFISVFIATIIGYLNVIIPILPSSVLGFQWAGLAWVFLFCVTIIALFVKGKISRKFIFLNIWVTYLLIYLLFDYSAMGLQLTLQYITPILLYHYFSDKRITIEDEFELANGLIKLCIFLQTVSILTYIIRGYSLHMAETPMLLSLGVTISLLKYVSSEKTSYLFLAIYFMLFPILNMTRMGILVSVLLFLSVLLSTRYKVKYRLLILFGLVLGVFYVFSSSKFIDKTFYGQKISFSELSTEVLLDRGTFNSSGRTLWYEVLEEGLKSNPYFGNGPRADAPLLGSVVGLDYGEAHSDYLSVRFNYGIVGLLILILALVEIFIYVLKRRNSVDMGTMLMSRVILLSFIPLLLFMTTDNILKYAIWFPNYFFLIIMGL